ncbi:hypothetical protein AVEN_204692-1 [Araneus ventricosus]|uniref:Uncharacterized protein n=1 Tax=Araneus ventricosus TaxID=182803 RepID=A0A4Y2GHQ7_ARAVE|nr:hypothetical protein AVEN_204692-1 [Araneus ventricosus]
MPYWCEETEKEYRCRLFMPYWCEEQRMDIPEISLPVVRRTEKRTARLLCCHLLGAKEAEKTAVRHALSGAKKQRIGQLNVTLVVKEAEGPARLRMPY